MPKFGSPIDVSGKVFPIKQQHCATVSAMLSLNVPKGFKTYCDELDGWYEYKGDNYETDATTGKWRKDSNDVIWHYVNALPPITRESRKYYIYHVVERTMLNGTYFDKILDQTLYDEDVIYELPEDIVNTNEFDSSEYSKINDILYINTNSNKAYPINVWAKFEDPENEDSEIIDLKYVLVNFFELNIVDSVPDEEGRFIVIDKPSEIAQNGHVYLKPKTINSKVYYNEYHQWGDCTIAIVKDISNYTIYTPTQGSSGTPSIPGGSEVLIPPYEVTRNYIVYISDDGTYSIYLYRDTPNGGMLMLDTDDIQIVRKKDDDYYDLLDEENSNSVGLDSSTNLISILYNSALEDICEEYLFINGSFELIGTDTTSKVKYLIENNNEELTSYVTSYVNSRLQQYDEILYTFEHIKFYPPLTEDNGVPVYYSDPSTFINTAGYTPVPNNFKIYELDISNYTRLKDDVDYVTNSNDEYNGETFESRLLILTDVTSDSISAIDRKWVYMLYYLTNEGFVLYPYGWIGIDSNSNVTIHKQNNTIDPQHDIAGISLNDIGVCDDYDTDYIWYSFIEGYITENIIEHNPSQPMQSAFPNETTQKEINEDLAITAFKFSKTFEQEAWIDEASDARDLNNISKKFVPASISSSNIINSDGFVIGDTVQALKSEAVEIAFAKPAMHDCDETEESTTWCYIGSSEPFTGTSDGIDYTFAWEKDDPSNNIAWRSTDVEAQTMNNNGDFVGDGIKIAGYKIHDNLAGKLIKELLNNN